LILEVDLPLLGQLLLYSGWVVRIIAGGLGECSTGAGASTSSSRCTLSAQEGVAPNVSEGVRVWRSYRYDGNVGWHTLASINVREWRRRGSGGGAVRSWRYRRIRTRGSKIRMKVSQRGWIFAVVLEVVRVYVGLSVICIVVIGGGRRFLLVQTTWLCWLMRLLSVGLPVLGVLALLLLLLLLLLHLGVIPMLCVLVLHTMGQAVIYTRRTLRIRCCGRDKRL
jgi:hypothetical protein